jgi:hypothetical protein
MTKSSVRTRRQKHWQRGQQSQQLQPRNARKRHLLHELNVYEIPVDIFGSLRSVIVGCRLRRGVSPFTQMLAYRPYLLRIMSFCWERLPSLL